jgi:catechol 2,3-dioxygenase-like lactoylglutathione lyase family enzyme
VLDHISLGVRDLARAAAFYDAVLAPLDYVRLWANDHAVGFGTRGAKDEPFALFGVPDAARAPGTGFHVALTATSRSAVDAFHAAAMRAGGTDEGSPGLRERYGPGYYAAFVRDLDGYKIEAVFHEPAGEDEVPDTL